MHSFSALDLPKNLKLWIIVGVCGYLSCLTGKKQQPEINAFSYNYFILSLKKLFNREKMKT